MLYHIIEKINLLLQQSILQFQIVQEKYDEFNVYLVLDDIQEKDEVESLFYGMLNEYQYKGVFSLIFVDCLYPSEKTGKHAWFISKMKGEMGYET